MVGKVEVGWIQDFWPSLFWVCHHLQLVPFPLAGGGTAFQSSLFSPCLVKGETFLTLLAPLAGKQGEDLFAFLVE